MTRKLGFLAAICLATLSAAAAQAGSMRYTALGPARVGVAQHGMSPIGGTFTLAGVLGQGLTGNGGFESFDDYSLVVPGNRILFAELKAEIYQSRGSGHGEHGDTVEATAAAEGGCGDEGGPGRTCLQLLDAQENVLCWAQRPKPPGWWGGDPHLACLLGEPKGRPMRLTLRVSLADEDCSDVVYPLPPVTDDGEPFALPYLLSVRSMPIASPGPGQGSARGVQGQF